MPLSPLAGGGATAAHPFVFDAFRAVRLAKAHGKYAAARRILVELHAFEAAIELAPTYAEGLAVVEEVLPAPFPCGEWLLFWPLCMISKVNADMHGMSIRPGRRTAVLHA